MKRRRLRIDRLLIVISIGLGIFWALHTIFAPKEIGLASAAGEDISVTKLEAKNPEEDGPHFRSLGTYKITYYCPGSCCNGSNAGVDCKGNPLVPGTIATNDLPYGTEVWISWAGEWVKYTVRDRMAKKDRPMPAIDIFVDLPHEVVQNMGVDYMEVFVLE